MILQYVLALIPVRKDVTRGGVGGLRNENPSAVTRIELTKALCDARFVFARDRLVSKTRTCRCCAASRSSRST